MKFGVFDHVDDSGLPLDQHLAARMEMVEAYEQAGFHCYHVAEHHGTPLGHAPSPGILFAALSQRTSTIRFGPLVYLLPLYHPLRLIEEVAMLDALSGGRFQLGVGRGISPIEMGFYGIDMDRQRALYEESLEVLLKGLANARLDHRGRFFRFDDVPLEQRPVQRPHPPLWYGTNSPASVAWCAQQGMNMVTLASGEHMQAMIGGYRAAYEATGGAPAEMPLVGVGRHVVVAETDEEALALARPAFARWRANFVHLWEARGSENPFVAGFPREWDEVEQAGSACAGSPAKVRDFIARDAEAGGYNYFVGQFAFGDLGVAHVKRSVALFAAEVMPVFG